MPNVAGWHIAIRNSPIKGTIMVEGTVKFFNTTKGYGFIAPNNGGKDAFVHISAVERSGLSTLNEGQKVSYELQTGRDGKESATNLKAL
jgi:CspA family cold shock protein